MDEEKCLHCGEEKPNYCEGCYQALISENIMLQAQIKAYRDTLKQIYKEIEGK